MKTTKFVFGVLLVLVCALVVGCNSTNNDDMADKDDMKDDGMKDDMDYMDDMKDEDMKDDMMDDMKDDAMMDDEMANDEGQSVSGAQNPVDVSNVDDYAEESKEKNTEGVIVISSKDIRRVITDDEPVSLRLDGTNAYITIADDTTVSQIEFNGDGNRVIIPAGQSPIVIDNGNYNNVYEK